MARRFSVISCDNKQVVVSGFVEPDTLSEVPLVVDVVSRTSIYELVDIVVLHLLFLDFEDAPVEDATEEEVEILQEQLPEMYDDGYIDTVEEIELQVSGINEEEELVTFITDVDEE